MSSPAMASTGFFTEGFLREMTTVRSGLKGALAALVGLGFASAALAQSADCERLRRQINEGGGSAQFSAAAERQAVELERMNAYARSIGCENHRFLIFGAEPPAQCGQIMQQIARMRANLDDLHARGGGRGDLMARYNAQCANQPRQTNLFDALFNNPRQSAPAPDAGGEPAAPEEGQPHAKSPEAHAGSQAVCVRTCDGSFFPISYSASGSRYGSLEDMCRALCPNADTELFSYAFGGDIAQAVAANGQRYMDTPNALKYRTTFDPNCSCKRKGESWAEALAGAETRLGPENKGDIIVTQQKADELSRPKVDLKPDPKAKTKTAKAPPTPAPGTDINGVDTVLSAQAQSMSREGSGIAGAADANAATLADTQGQTESEVGPDGVIRRVRIVGPKL